MNLLSKNELLKLLNSPDIENRQIAETYLLSNFDLDFQVRIGTNIFTSNPFCEIEKREIKGLTHNVEQLLYWLIYDKYPTPYLKPLLDTIYEYNNK